jgi:alanine dehydrogenase
LRYALRLADNGLIALQKDAGFLKGLNTYAGKLTYPGVAEAFNLEVSSPVEALGLAG